MQNRITATITTAIAAVSIASLSAPASADSVTFDYSSLHETGFPGGEFIAEFANGSTYRTFCLESDEELSVSYNLSYQYSLDTDGAVGGGASGGSTDPISSATASVYLGWLNGDIDQTTENSTAVQNAIWALEGEIDPNSLDGNAEDLYNEAVANFSTSDNAITDNELFSNLRVLNPFRDIEGERFYYQSQIILIPLPAASGLALAGLAAVGMRRRR
jgi:hypothetical protein